jgi:hypothetical protein
MRRLLLCAALVFPAVRLPALPIEISTGKLAEGLAWTPLDFETRGIPEGMTVRLRSDAGGDVPCQVERAAEAVRITWVVKALEKGKEAAWMLEAVKDEGSRPPPRVEARAAGHAVEILADGKEIARLLADPAEQKPYVFPLIGPNGKMITRQFPMRKGVEGEKQDHPHQRSFWFTHGSVGGVDFWSEGSRAGRIRQVKVESLESGPVFARIVTRNEWITPDGKKLLDDRRVLTVYPLERGETLIDFEVALTATDAPVVLGDTKEGTFGIRLAESMKEERGGTILSSRGGRGMDETWGKPAEWVDYHGRVEGDRVGVAILDHPKSFRHPTHWHVRNYGLFAANPFGYDDFDSPVGKDGTHELAKGATIEFRYRVYLHHGNAEEAQVPLVYRGFASPPALESTAP